MTIKNGAAGIPGQGGGSAALGVAGTPITGGSTGDLAGAGQTGGAGGSTAGTAGAGDPGTARAQTNGGSSAAGTSGTAGSAGAAGSGAAGGANSHSGMSSVHMKFGTASGATFISESKGFPAPNGYWGRVWLYVTTGLETGHHVYIEGSFGGDPTNTGVCALNTQSGGFLATNNAHPDKGGTSPTQKMPQGQWTCFEWHVVPSGGKENVNL